MRLFAVQSYTGRTDQFPSPGEIDERYRVTLHYTDSDDDKVVVGSDVELHGALKLFADKGIVKIMADVVPAPLTAASMLRQSKQQAPFKRGPGRPPKKQKLMMMAAAAAAGGGGNGTAGSGNSFEHISSMLPRPMNGSMYTPLECVKFFELPALQGKKIRSQTYQYLLENELVGIKNKRSIQKWIKGKQRAKENTRSVFWGVGFWYMCVR